MRSVILVALLSLVAAAEPQANDSTEKLVDKTADNAADKLADKLIDNVLDKLASKLMDKLIGTTMIKSPSSAMTKIPQLPQRPAAFRGFQPLPLVSNRFGTLPTNAVGRTWNFAPLTIRSDADLEDKVKKIIVENLNVDEAKVKNEAKFIDDLGADSLDTVELLMALEEELGTEIPEEEAQKITTVQDVIDYAKKSAR